MEQKAREAVNPYPVGTKKYQVAKMLLTGEEDSGKISSEVAVKLAAVYNKGRIEEAGIPP